MPVIPEFTNNVATATAPLPRADVRQSSAIADSIARGGAQLEATVEPWAERYAASRRAVMASDAMVDAQHGLAQSAQQWSRRAGTLDENGKIIGTDQAVNGFNDQAQQLRTQAVGQIADPLVKEQVAHSFNEAMIGHAESVRSQGFSQERLARLGQLDTQLNGLAQDAAATSTPEGKLNVTNTAATAIGTLRDAGFINGEEAATRGIAFTSHVQAVGVHQELNSALDLADRDPDAALRLARKINDPASYPGLLPEQRESLGRQAENIAYRLTVQASARAQKEDAAEAKALRQTQATNEAKLLSDVYDNKPVDIAAATAMASNQQISVAGLQAVHAALDRQREGKDDPLARIDLQQRIQDGEDVHADIRQAIIDHKLSGPTAGALMTQNGARQGKGDNAIDRANFNALKTVLGGDAVEKGMLNFDNKAHVQQIQSWARAQIEWGNRVLVGGEDSRAVLTDMLPRYQSSNYPPATWAAPRLGAVSSSQDVAAVWGKTKAAAAAGQITPDQLGAETDLLGRYRQFYADQDARRAATAVKPAPGGGGAKLRNITTGDE